MRTDRLRAKKLIKNLRRQLKGAHDSYENKTPCKSLKIQYLESVSTVRDKSNSSGAEGVSHGKRSSPVVELVHRKLSDRS